MHPFRNNWRTFQLFKITVCCAIAFATGLVPGDGPVASGQETLPALKVGTPAPANFAQMWNGFDPRAEPLEVETLQEWEEDGVVLRIVRFRIGIFKGEKASLAAIYGYPKNIESGTKIPGLLQIHGGGQFADHRACVANAKRGYATLSIAWAGRISAPKYRVNSSVVKLFWDGKTDDPNYRVTTDWGAVDGYHAPGRNPKNQFPSAKPYDFTLDAVESPRNSGWFLCAVAARRGLTFLEQQPEVDPERLGVYGHSMGGKLTVMASVDPRVKAAAPSCGGISDRDNDSELFRKTIGDDVSLQQIKCPIIFLSPANDFHGRIGDLPKSVKEIKSNDWRVTCAPHHNHQDTAEYEVATLLWFDQQLQGKFAFPKTPATQLSLKTADGVPAITVEPDVSRPIQSMDIYFTQQGKADETRFDREQTMTRMWHHAVATRSGNSWSAKLPLANTDKPLWVYANVSYGLDQPVSGVGYYYGDYTTDKFNVSSLLATASPAELKAAGCKPTRKPSNLIEDFEKDWEKEWFAYRASPWSRTTHKLGEETYQGPADATLSLDVRAEKENELVILLDNFAKVIKVKGGNEWQSVQLKPGDFQNYEGEALAKWKTARVLKLAASERLRPAKRDGGEPRMLGKNWVGNPPEFRSLKWVPGIEANNTESRADDSTPRTEDDKLLDVFAPTMASVSGERLGKSTFNEQFSPSKSNWAEGLDESQVFQIEMNHQQEAANSFSLRIGKGGQVYSLRGPFGESVPPSWREKNSTSSPWNDEVWQFVAVCSKYNGTKAILKAGTVAPETIKSIEGSPYATTFFIHNSGAYIPRNSRFDSFYCPLLAAKLDAEDRCFRMVNWGLVPQTKTIHRSPLLYYTQVRDIGDGIIELTWVVHNFSDREDVVFDYMNAPWGGTRVSSLPYQFVGNSNNEPVPANEILSEHNTILASKTGGWNLACASESENSPSLALVFGRDKHLANERKKEAGGQPHCQTAPSIYRAWRANEGLYKSRWKDWRTRPSNDFRNYDVVEFIPKFRLEPGSSVWYRSFLVVGSRKQAIENAKLLVDHVDYGFANFERNNAEQVTVSFAGIEFEVFSKPVPGSKPLFQIQDLKSGKQVLTTDPYTFVEQSPLNFQISKDHALHDYFNQAVGYTLDKTRCDWQRLVGFGLVEKPESGEWIRLSKILNQDKFPVDDRHQLDLWVRSKTQ